MKEETITILKSEYDRLKAIEAEREKYIKERIEEIEAEQKQLHAEMEARHITGVLPPYTPPSLETFMKLNGVW